MAASSGSIAVDWALVGITSDSVLAPSANGAGTIALPEPISAVGACAIDIEERGASTDFHGIVPALRPTVSVHKRGRPVLRTPCARVFSTPPARRLASLSSLHHIQIVERCGECHIANSTNVQ